MATHSRVSRMDSTDDEIFLSNNNFCSDNVLFFTDNLILVAWTDSWRSRQQYSAREHLFIDEQICPFNLSDVQNFPIVPLFDNFTQMIVFFRTKIHLSLSIRKCVGAEGTTQQGIAINKSEIVRNGRKDATGTMS